MSLTEPIPGDPRVDPVVERPSAVDANRTARRRKAADRAARWVVTGGGMAIIAGILGILLFIVLEVSPLTRRADLTPGPELTVQADGDVALIVDEHRSHTALLSTDGMLRVIRTADGRLVDERPVVDGETTLVRVANPPGRQQLAAATADGRVALVSVGWGVSFEGSDRMVTPRISDPVIFELDPSRGAVGVFAAGVNDDGGAACAGVLADGTLVLIAREVEENLFTGEIRESWSRTELEAPADLRELVLDRDLRTLYGGAGSGALYTWRLAEDPIVPRRVVGEDSASVSALSLLLGDRSLVVGRANGALEIWFDVRDGGDRELTEIRSFPPQAGAITLLAPSFRDKGFLAHDATGGLGLYYSTSGRVLWTGRSPLERATGMFYTPKADGAFFAQLGRVAAVEIDNPHPEVGLGALFGRVWYEGYKEPEYVWQSTGGSDEFEPKLSMTPLLVGTFKGTIYSLLLAIPLGVLGAMYTSQFMHPRYKRVVKPTVEIMAALPSVVLGFLAGLWLAPRLEQALVGLLLMLFVLPLMILGTWGLLRRMPNAIRAWTTTGFEIFPYMVVVSIGIWLSLALSPRAEQALFGGDFQGWLTETTGLAYDQRNAVVVGLAMGFAVIPVIFAISEDAFSNVPPNLVTGSLALGASRWQTVVRVVLPSASPGIFSAVMVGFGRAVGETMIVLMATGNTPLLDWNPFNGFRTLAANIAVEIPEAPHGGTLYRSLFLAALLLFAFTFIINTVAELIRQRLARRYQQG